MKNKLKQIALITMLCAVFYSCETTVKREQTTEKFAGNTIQILTIDSCEYIYIYQGTSTWGSHKGNCKFCASRNK